jgi:addiction module RelE/StbE family toxin
MQIRWEADTIEDLVELRAYIEKENPEVANKVANKILEAVDLLLEHPLLGKAGRIYKTRELVIVGTPYTIVYFPEAELITVLRIFHQAMSWDKFGKS